MSYAKLYTLAQEWMDQAADHLEAAQGLVREADPEEFELNLESSRVYRECACQLMAALKAEAS